MHTKSNQLKIFINQSQIRETAIKIDYLSLKNVNQILIDSYEKQLQYMIKLKLKDNLFDLYVVVETLAEAQTLQFHSTKGMQLINILCKLQA